LESIFEDHKAFIHQINSELTNRVLKLEALSQSQQKFIPQIEAPSTGGRRGRIRVVETGTEAITYIQKLSRGDPSALGCTLKKSEALLFEILVSDRDSERRWLRVLDYSFVDNQSQNLVLCFVDDLSYRPYLKLCTEDLPSRTIVSTSSDAAFKNVWRMDDANQELLLFRETNTVALPIARDIRDTEICCFRDKQSINHNYWVIIRLYFEPL